jgi:hypothetical protein
VRMGSEWILGKLAGGGGSVEWIQLDQDKDRRRAVVNTVGSGATDLVGWVFGWLVGWFVVRWLVSLLVG